MLAERAERTTAESRRHAARARRRGARPRPASASASRRARGVDRARVVHRAPHRARLRQGHRVRRRLSPGRRSRRSRRSPAARRPRRADVCAALDARKREVYAALYERDGGRARRGCGEPCAIAPSAWRRALRPAVRVRRRRRRRLRRRVSARARRRAPLLPSATHPPSAVAVAARWRAPAAAAAATTSARSSRATSGRPRRSWRRARTRRRSAPMRNFVDKVPSCTRSQTSMFLRTCLHFASRTFTHSRVVR